MYRANHFSEIREFVDSCTEKKTIGFIPTMGALHPGHISLVTKSIADNDFTIVSIFVNPTQFNNPKDFEKYPNTLDKDLALLEAAGVDIVFLPQVSEIYPTGNEIDTYHFNGLDRAMEGAFRPGHFEGMATVVGRFLTNIVPHKAYFGEKDFQQLRIIQELVHILQLPTQIIPMPIFREEDGLAMSSRNLLLSYSMRSEAPLIYKVLQEVKNQFPKTPWKELQQEVIAAFSTSPLLLEYFIIADEKYLQARTRFSSTKKYRAFIACYAYEIRLIDNIALWD